MLICPVCMYAGTQLYLGYRIYQPQKFQHSHKNNKSKFLVLKAMKKSLKLYGQC